MRTKQRAMFITAYKLNTPLHTVLPISDTLPITPSTINNKCGNSRHTQQEWEVSTVELIAACHNCTVLDDSFVILKCAEVQSVSSNKVSLACHEIKRRLNYEYIFYNPLGRFCLSAG
jgi:hypothetical protein